jgi:intracellular septation protein
MIPFGQSGRTVFSYLNPETPELKIGWIMRLWSLAVEVVPLGVFFAGYQLYDIFTAAAASVVAAAIVLSGTWLAEKRIAVFPIFSVVLSGALTAAAIIFSDAMLIKIQPTIFNGLFALVLLGGFALGHSMMRVFFGAQFRLNDRTWLLLSLRWGVFLAGLAIANEFAWRLMDEEGWVWVKVFVLAPLVGLFALLQLPLTLKGRLPAD